MRKNAFRLFGDQRGNILIVTAAAIPVLIGAAGLAIDTVQWTLWKRQIQRQADSAALAGAFARAQSKNVTARANADITRTTEFTLYGSPLIENAPTTGAYAGDSRAVRVVLKIQRALPFAGLFMATAPVIEAEATAAVLTNGNYCILSLESTNATGLTMQGNATLDMGCGMATNSSGTAAISAGGSSTIVATPVAAVGGITQNSNFVPPTTFLPYSIPQLDPFASLPTPAPTSCSGKINVSPGANQTISPGCYRGMDIKGVLNLSPGTYYVVDNGFEVGALATINGTGVTIILTTPSGSSNLDEIPSITINGGATINLTAPTSGTYEGVLFYQDRRASFGINKINGNSSSKYEGAIYMPSQLVEWTGTSGMDVNCLQIIARRVTFSGNSNITNSCPPGSGSGAIPGTRVLLVG